MANVYDNLDIVSNYRDVRSFDLYKEILNFSSIQFEQQFRTKMKLLFVPGKRFNQRKKHFYQILTTLGPKLTVTLRKCLPPTIQAGSQSGFQTRSSAISGQNNSADSNRKMLSFNTIRITKMIQGFTKISELTLIIFSLFQQ